ncbi:MAG TPA: caspase family protein, partial [Acidimicrobiales bacterium]
MIGLPLSSDEPPQVAGAVVDRGSAAGGRADRSSGSEPPPAGAEAGPGGDVAIAPPPDSFDAPPAPPAPPPAQLDATPPRAVTGTGTWAVMIGINDYPGTRHDLRSAVADADDVNLALARMGVPGSQRLLIRDRQATAATVKRAAEWLRNHAGPDAVAVFFYAGHIRDLGHGTQAIVGADGALVTDKDLAAVLNGVQARRAWVALAACYAGGFTEVRKPGWVLTAAAGARELAYENERFGRSYMVEYMVRRAMIEGHAAGSVEASFNWARSELARDFPNRLPVQYDDDPAELDLRQPGARVLAPSPTSTVAPPPETTAPSDGSGSAGGSGDAGGSGGSGGGAGGS